MAGAKGVEPLLTAPKTVVLPLDDAPVSGKHRLYSMEPNASSGKHHFSDSKLPEV